MSLKYKFSSQFEARFVNIFFLGQKGSFSFLREAFN